MGVRTSRVARVVAPVAALVLGGLSGVSALAQGTGASDGRVEALERRLGELERQRQEDQREIGRLRARLEGEGATQPASGGSSGAAGVDATTEKILRDIERRQSAPIGERLGVNFNPDISVIVDAVGTWGSRRENDAYNRFDMREAELDLRAAIEPRADGVLVLAFARDVENPVFPSDEPPEGPETSVEVEEAYAFLHDFGVPNLTAKVGRFHVRFGRQNVLHLHDLPTSDPPFVNQAFLAPESLTDAGVSLSYLVPPELVGGQYVEVVAELISGEGAGSESPTLGGDLSADSPAANFHALWNADLGREWNLELGASWLTGHADRDNRRDVNLFGFDATLVRKDPRGQFNNQLFQAEAIYGVVDQEGGGTSHAWGAYVLGQQQLNQDWYVGLRLDWTEDPNEEDAEAWGASPYLSWYLSEFLRLRAEYQYRGGDVPSESVLYFQVTWIFGAHTPHPYWSMR